MTIDDKQQEIIDEFSEINDWMDRYGYIIDLGNSLPPIDESLKTPDRLIEGCQSRVWLDATVDNDGNIHFSADSDAIIVKGIISLLTKSWVPTSTSLTTSALVKIYHLPAPTDY